MRLIATVYVLYSESTREKISIGAPADRAGAPIHVIPYVQPYRCFGYALSISAIVILFLI